MEQVSSLTHRARTTQQEPFTALEAAVALFGELEQHGLRYCLWKSNVRLQEGLNGKTDLDLLVEPEQLHLFGEILRRHELKPLRAAPGKDYPGVYNYLGFDRASGRLFHLHVHSHLILGEQMVKNYVLPWRDHFLDAAILEHGLRIPAPELELIVFCVRALLKYRDRDALKDALAIRSSGLSKAVLEELRWLRTRSDPRRFTHTLQTVEDILPADIVLQFLATVDNEPRNGVLLFRLRERLHAALRPYRRYSRIHASLTYFRELWFRRRRRMQLKQGGCSLALVGADGAGKSTMSKLLHSWLSWKLDVRPFYLGSKKPSRRSKALYLLFRILRRSQRSTSDRLGEQNFLARRFAGWRQIVYYQHLLSLARDRLARNRAAEAIAQEGAIVIYDRYPLAPRLDGPKLGGAVHENGSRLTRRFQQREKALYDSFERPDHILLLDATLDISLARKPDHDRAAIQEKYEQLQALCASGQPPLIRIDATREMRVVAGQLKEIVWQLL